MRKLIQGFSFVLLVSSCAVTAPEIRGGESFNIEQIEGNKVNLNVGANIHNGNWFGIRVKPSNLDLFLNDDFLGTVRLDKKVKLKRKSETAIDANLTATLENGAMGKAMRSALGGGLNVRLKGRVKAGVFIFSKKIDFDETKKIDASELRP